MLSQETKNFLNKMKFVELRELIEYCVDNTKRVNRDNLQFVTNDIDEISQYINILESKRKPIYSPPIFLPTSAKSSHDHFFDFDKEVSSLKKSSENKLKQKEVDLLNSKRYIRSLEDKLLSLDKKLVLNREEEIRQEELREKEIIKKELEEKQLKEKISSLQNRMVELEKSLSTLNTKLADLPIQNRTSESNTSISSLTPIQERLLYWKNKMQSSKKIIHKNEVDTLNNQSRKIKEKISKIKKKISTSEGILREIKIPEKLEVKKNEHKKHEVKKYELKRKLEFEKFKFEKLLMKFEILLGKEKNRDFTAEVRLKKEKQIEERKKQIEADIIQEVKPSPKIVSN